MLFRWTWEEPETVGGCPSTQPVMGLENEVIDLELKELME